MVYHMLSFGFSSCPCGSNAFKITLTQSSIAETHCLGERNYAICSKPVLCYRKTEELHLVVCEKSSTYLPAYRMHVVTFNELLLICSCIFVVKR